ncbi:MAG TPA: hypothetical protein VF730_07715, partial [Terracidiphilus sp.]
MSAENKKDRIRVPREQPDCEAVVTRYGSMIRPEKTNRNIGRNSIGGRLAELLHHYPYALGPTMIKVKYFCWICLLICTSGVAQDVKQLATDPNLNEQQSDAQAAPAPPSLWQYGGFIDAAYLLDFNHPANDLFRSRGT